MLNEDNKTLTTETTGEQSQDTAQRTYAGISLSERKSLRKKQFLEAGLRLFGQSGFRNATVRSICKEAKLTDRYFYQSFGNLENLLKAVYENCMTHLSKEILKAIIEGYENQDPEEAITAGLNAYFLVLEDPNIARICMVELEGISEEVNELYYRYIDSFADILTLLTNKAFPDLGFNEAQQRTIAISLVGAMRQAATDWYVNDYKTPRVDLVSATSQLFLGLIKLVS